MARTHFLVRAARVAALLLWAAWPGALAAQQVKWDAVSPNFEGQTYVNNDRVCAQCHARVTHAGFDQNAHTAQYFTAGSTALKGTCESCHGPRSRHAKDEKRVAPWTTITATSQSVVCLQCHTTSSRMNFTAGAHMSGDVSCTSCHSERERVAGGAGLVRTAAHTGSVGASNGGLGRTGTSSATCYGCHSDVRSQMSKASHHPVEEGRMECSSCHNVHGSNPSLLKTTTVNETCTSCHAEKRGPFVWEHAPVLESCQNCHAAHGTTNRKLLTRKEAFGCLQCHSYGGHINLPRYNRTSNPYGEGCVNCHMTIHGSNHPSGAKFTR